MHLPIPLKFPPMEARLAKELPRSGPYQFEPKWDGFRAICFRDGDEVALQSKSRQPLARYFPEIVDAALTLSTKKFVLDGELVVPVDDRLDFEQLLQRIHPAASRVRKLAEEFPATYLVFDLLVDDKGNAVYELPLVRRRVLLEAFAAKYFKKTNERFRLSPATLDRKVVQRWFDSAGSSMDGIIAKRLDMGYSSGDRNGMIKVKNLRTADCVVGGYRSSGNSVGSLLLGLYDENGLLDYVGFTSGFGVEEKKSLFKQLSAMKAARSFTGRTPGGPSRWNRGKESEWVPVKPELVLEVQFDHVTNGRFRHGTRPLRFRPDKNPRQCTTEQIT
ncbi:MAG TPA: ATP-dependent DNA ligase [Candidatus Baltobacteraceae bacterium]|nr:ATP-dependent DNA ligase [Candidatus Baltobacteraceae bacterium]